MSSGWNQPSSSNYRSPPRDNPFNNGFWEPFRQAYGQHEMSHHRNMEIPPPPQQLPNNNYDMVVHSLSPQYEKNNQRDMEEDEDEEDMEEEDPRQKMTRSEAEAFRWAVSNYHFEDVKQCLEIIDNSRLLKICSESPFPLHGIIRNNHPERMGKGERIVRMVISRINQSILGVKDNHGNLLIDRAIYANMESLVTFLLDLGTPLSNTNNKNMETIDAVVIMLNPRILGMCMMKGVTSHQMDTRYQELQHYHRSRDYFERSAHHKKIAMATTLASCQEKRDNFFKFHSQSIPIADISQIISVPIGRNPNFGRQHVVFFRFPQLGFIGDCYVEHFRLVIVPADFKMNAVSTVRKPGALVSNSHVIVATQKFIGILMATEHGIRLSTNPKLNDRKCRLMVDEGVYDCSQVVRSQMMNPLKWYEDEMNPRNVFRLKVHFSDHETSDFALCAIVRLGKPQIRQEIRYPSPDIPRSPEYEPSEDFHDHQNQRNRGSPATPEYEEPADKHYHQDQRNHQSPEYEEHADSHRHQNERIYRSPADTHYHQNQRDCQRSAPHYQRNQQDRRQIPATPEYENPADNHYHQYHQNRHSSAPHYHQNEQDREISASPNYEDSDDSHDHRSQRNHKTRAPHHNPNQQDRRIPASPENGDSDDSHNHQDEQDRQVPASPEYEDPADNHYHQDQQDQWNHQSPADSRRNPNQHNRRRPATPEYEARYDSHLYQNQRDRPSPAPRYHQNQQDRRQLPASPNYEDSDDSHDHRNQRNHQSPAPHRNPNQQDRRSRASPDYGDSHNHQDEQDRQVPASPEYEDADDSHQSPAPRYHQDEQDFERPATPEYEARDDTHQDHEDRRSSVDSHNHRDHRVHQITADTHHDPNQQDHERPTTPEHKEPVAPHPIRRGRGRQPRRPTDPVLAHRQIPATPEHKEPADSHRIPNQQDRQIPVAPHRNPSTRVRRPPRRYQHPSPARPIPGDESEASETEEEMCAGPLHPPKKKKPKKVPVPMSTKDQQVENRKLRAERRSRRSNEASCSTDQPSCSTD